MFRTGNIDGYFEDRSLCNNDKVGVRLAVWIKYAKSDNSKKKRFRNNKDKNATKSYLLLNT